jgi:hypothetical protein
MMSVKLFAPNGTPRLGQLSPFWVEDKGEYTAATRYDPDLDTRPLCTIRVDVKEGRTFILENYRCDSNDPVAIWADIISKYGFAATNITQLEISGKPEDGLIVFKFKLPTSLQRITLRHLVARSFKVFLANDPWCSGEMLSPATHDRAKVWEQLQELAAIPHFSQFQFVQDTKELTCQNWPHGEILALRIRFPVTWQIETSSAPIIQENMTTEFKVEDAWQQLHHIAPRLFPRATFNYAGLLKPDQVISAEVLREEIEVTGRFEVKDHRHISFENVRIANMMLRPDIHDMFAQLGPRIPPYAQYIDVDDRPHYSETTINFNLHKDIEITDRSDEGPGRLGGNNGHDITLPPIIYPTAPIDVSKGKVSGGKTGPVDSESSDSCPTDSSLDAPREDAHKLVQIAQAIHKQASVTVCLKWHFKGFQGQESVVLFKRNHGGPPPVSMQELFQKAFNEIAASAPLYSSSGIPGSLDWMIVPFTSDSLDLSVVKIGKGLTVSFTPKVLPGLPVADFPGAYTLELAGNWFISFGAEERASDRTLMQYLINITSPWDGKAYGKPWQVLLSAQFWRHSDTGEIFLAAAPDYPQDMNPQLLNPRIPMNAAQPRTSVIATRPKEISRLLKFGRDSDWPLYIAVASTLDGTNSATVSYQSSWENCDVSTMWFLNQFAALSGLDNLIGLPVASRQGIPWTASLRKENNSIRVTLHEKTPDGTFMSTRKMMEFLVSSFMVQERQSRCAVNRLTLLIAT